MASRVVKRVSIDRVASSRFAPQSYLPSPMGSPQRLPARQNRRVRRALGRVVRRGAYTSDSKIQNAFAAARDENLPQRGMQTKTKQGVGPPSLVTGHPCREPTASVKSTLPVVDRSTHASSGLQGNLVTGTSPATRDSGLIEDLPNCALPGIAVRMQKRPRRGDTRKKRPRKRCSRAMKLTGDTQEPQLPQVKEADSTPVCSGREEVGDGVDIGSTAPPLLGATISGVETSVSQLTCKARTKQRRRAYRAPRASAFLGIVPDGRITWWIIDSGANVVVVPCDSSNIVRWLSKTVPLQTANGQAKGYQVIVHTPLGDIQGIAVFRAPHLLPMWKLTEGKLGSFLWLDHIPAVSWRGKQLSVRVKTGTPMLAYKSLEGKSSDKEGYPGEENLAMLAYNPGIPTGVQNSQNLKMETNTVCPNSILEMGEPGTALPSQFNATPKVSSEKLLHLPVCELPSDTGRTKTFPEMRDSAQQTPHDGALCCYVTTNENMPEGFEEAMSSLYSTSTFAKTTTDLFDAHWVANGCINWQQDLQGKFAPKIKQTNCKQFARRAAEMFHAQNACSFAVRSEELESCEVNHLDCEATMHLHLTVDDGEVRSWYPAAEGTAFCAESYLRLFAADTYVIAPGETQSVRLGLSILGSRSGKPAAWYLQSLPGENRPLQLAGEHSYYSATDGIDLVCKLLNTSAECQTVSTGTCVARATGTSNRDVTYSVAQTPDDTYENLCGAFAASVCPCEDTFAPSRFAPFVAMPVNAAGVPQPWWPSDRLGTRAEFDKLIELRRRFYAGEFVEDPPVEENVDPTDPQQFAKNKLPVVKTELDHGNPSRDKKCGVGHQCIERNKIIAHARRVFPKMDLSKPPPDWHYFTHQPSHPNCEACIRAKIKYAQQRKLGTTALVVEEKSIIPGERIAADLCTPWPSGAAHSEDTLCVLRDEATGLISLRALQDKTPHGIILALNEFRVNLRTFRKFAKSPEPEFWFLKTDQGGEFSGKEMDKHLSEHSGKYETVAKGRHVAIIEQTVLQSTEGIRCLLTAAGLPASYWPFAATTFAHNYNLELHTFANDVPKFFWKEFLTHKKGLGDAIIFGQLLYTKLPSDLQALPKGVESGSPVAMLGPLINSRRAVNVLYLRQAGIGAGKYHTTSVDDRGWKESSPATMAFQRIYEDLITLSVPGFAMAEEGADIGSPDLHRQENVEVASGILKPTNFAGKNRGSKGRWVHPHRKCEGCRNANKKHTFSGRGLSSCRWSGLDNAKLTELLAIGKRGTDHPVVGDSINTKIDNLVSNMLENDMSWNEALADFSDSVAKQKETMRLAALDKAGLGSIPANLPETVNRRNHASRHALFAKEKERALTACHAFEANIEKPVTTGWRHTIELMEKEMLIEQDRSKMIGDSASADMWDTLDEYIHIASAFVTRNMTRQERVSDLAKKALADELHKVESKGTFGKPINYRTAAMNFPDGTVSGLCMLGSVKYAEKAIEFQKYKGRLVVLGNAINRLKDHVSVYPKGADYGMQGQVASLAAFRAVAWHSTHAGYSLEAADVSNAYLNAPWPEHHQPHFLRMDKIVYDSLCPETQKLVRDAGGWHDVLLPMDKCLYGHPISGFLWIEMLRKWLMEDQGFIEVEGTPSLFRRGEMLICAYVDDVAAAGPAAEVKQLWKDMGTKWDLRESEDCSEFLGIQVSRKAVAGGFEVHLSMADYVGGILKTLKSDFPEAVLIKKYTPMTESHDSYLAKQHEREAVKPQHRCMKIVGQLIWLARCVRFDVSYAVSKLASGISRWGEEHTNTLAHLCGYLMGSADLSLTFRPRDPNRELLLQICPDASWQAPRSQSGSCLVLGHVEPGRIVDGKFALWTDEEILDGQQPFEVLALLEGSSNRQSLSADSSAASELISAHTAIRTTLPMALGLRETWNITSKINLREDNKALWEVARSGKTKGLGWLETKPICIRACCLFDLVQLDVLICTYVRTHNQLGDGFTKALDRTKLEIARLALGLTLPPRLLTAKCAAVQQAFSCIRVGKGWRSAKV